MTTFHTAEEAAPHLPSPQNLGGGVPVALCRRMAQYGALCQPPEADQLATTLATAQAVNQSPARTRRQADALLGRLLERLVGLAKYLGASASLADDLAQDAVVAVLTKMHGPDPCTNPAAYGRMVVVRRFLRGARRQARTVASESVPEQPVASTGRREAARIIVNAVVAGLPVNDRPLLDERLDGRPMTPQDRRRFHRLRPQMMLLAEAADLVYQLAEAA